MFSFPFLYLLLYFTDVGRSSARSIQESLSDEVLDGIAGDIESDEHAQNLGTSLGFKRAESRRYIATNWMSGCKTYAGTRTMLYDWRQRTPPGEQPTKLRSALMDSGMIMLSERHLKTEEGNTNLHIFLGTFSESIFFLNKKKTKT